MTPTRCMWPLLVLLALPIMAEAADTDPPHGVLGVRPELGLDLAIAGPLPSTGAVIGSALVLDLGMGPLIEPALHLTLGKDHVGLALGAGARFRYRGLEYPVYPDASGGIVVEMMHSSTRGNFAALLARLGAGAHYHLSDEIGIGIEAGVDLGVALGVTNRFVARIRLALSAVLLL